MLFTSTVSFVESRVSTSGLATSVVELCAAKSLSAQKISFLTSFASLSLSYCSLMAVSHNFLVPRLTILSFYTIIIANCACCGLIQPSRTLIVDSYQSNSIKVL